MRGQTGQRKRYADQAVPVFWAAVLESLRLDDPSGAGLEGLDEREWARALEFCDKTQLTLLLNGREHVERALEKNSERLRRARATLFGILDRLEAAGLDALVLKGLTQWPAFVRDPRLRPQYDLDLYLPAEDVLRARDILLEMGYEALGQFERFPTDHLPAMVLKTGWEWRGDYFDPEIPFSVELHFRFWDEETERLRAPGVEEFWERRVGRQLEGRRITALAPEDALGYTALHLLRHLLRGNLRPYHVYELAWFLEQHAEDGAFWESWQRLHSQEMRRLESVAFGLARAWFGCRGAEREPLPPGARAWLERYWASPLEGLFSPNKHELGLHLALLEERRDRMAVLRRRLLPGRLPGPVDAVHTPREQLTWRRRARARARYAVHVAGRAWFHLRVLPGLVRFCFAKTR